jgi:hypothetical protein
MNRSIEGIDNVWPISIKVHIRGEQKVHWKRDDRGGSMLTQFDTIVDRVAYFHRIREDDINEWLHWNHYINLQISSSWISKLTQHCFQKCPIVDEWNNYRTNVSIPWVLYDTNTTSMLYLQLNEIDGQQNDRSAS